ncbi:hypothetical protein WY02_17405 [Pseudonocardia sp. AL041005-10]|nr:hypothetical protein WY02_17405 [Pseudonocardia sp. AL041005-10]
MIRRSAAGGVGGVIRSPSRDEPQRLCGAAGDGGAVGGREPGGVEAGHRVGHAHVEGVVGTEQHPVGTDGGDERPQCLRGVHQRVEPQMPQIGRRRQGAASGLRPYLPCVVRPPQVGRQVSAAVGGEHAQTGVPVQHPREDQVGERDGVLHRLADGVGQVEAVEALVERATERVQEHHRAGLLRPCPEAGQPGVGQLDPGGPGGDLDPLEPPVESLVEGVRAQLRVLQRDQAEPDEPVGRLRDDVGDPLSRRTAHGPGELRARPVVVMRR